jgi:hypothetical protein
LNLFLSTLSYAFFLLSLLLPLLFLFFVFFCLFFFFSVLFFFFFFSSSFFSFSFSELHIFTHFFNANDLMFMLKKMFLKTYPFFQKTPVMSSKSTPELAGPECMQCTFVNLPKSVKCGMCDFALPPVRAAAVATLAAAAATPRPTAGTREADQLLSIITSKAHLQKLFQAGRPLSLEQHNTRVLDVRISVLEGGGYCY